MSRLKPRPAKQSQLRPSHFAVRPLQIKKRDRPSLCAFSVQRLTVNSPARGGLQDAFGPILQRVFQLSHELMGHGTVHYAVIVGERQIHHAANGYRVVNYYRALFDCAQAEDRDIGLIDYRQAEQAAEDAGVGDGEGAFGDFLGLEFFGAGAFGKIVHGARDAQEIFLLGILYDWNDQAPVESYGDADVAFFVQDDVGAVDRGIDGGKGAQSFHGSAHEEGHEGELGAAGFFKLRFHFGAQRRNRRHIRFVHGIDVRGDVL